MRDKKLRPRVVGGCFGGGAIALAYTDSRLAVVAGDPGKLRRVAQQPLPNLAFAGPIDIDDDGRFELAAPLRRNAVVHVGRRSEFASHSSPSPRTPSLHLLTRDSTRRER